MPTLYFLCQAELIASIRASELSPSSRFWEHHNGSEGYLLDNDINFAGFIVNRVTQHKSNWTEAEIIIRSGGWGVGYALVPIGQQPNAQTIWRRLQCCARTLEGED